MRLSGPAGFQSSAFTGFFYSWVSYVFRTDKSVGFPRAVANYKKHRMILDMTCGGRHMWFDKDHDGTIYADIRLEPSGAIEQQPEWNVTPDIVCDWGALPFNDNSFDLVVFDPPHAHVLNSSIIGMKYGSLFGDWKPTLRLGLLEAWRVTSTAGTLVFKWAESPYPVATVLGLVPEMKPAFGHTTGKAGKTIWVTFH